MQAKALQLTESETALISPVNLAHAVFEQWPITGSQHRSARRALQRLAAQGKITDHGFSGGTGHKLYGRPMAKQAQMQSAYVAVMAEMAENQRRAQG